MMTSSARRSSSTMCWHFHSRMMAEVAMTLRSQGQEVTQPQGQEVIRTFPQFYINQHSWSRYFFWPEKKWTRSWNYHHKTKAIGTLHTCNFFRPLIFLPKMNHSMGTLPLQLMSIKRLLSDSDKKVILKRQIQFMIAISDIAVRARLIWPIRVKAQGSISFISKKAKIDKKYVFNFNQCTYLACNNVIVTPCDHLAWYPLNTYL